MDDSGHNKRESVRKKLVALSLDCELWHSPDMHAWVSVDEDDSRQNWPVPSENFGRWLTNRLHQETGKVPSRQAIHDAMHVVASKAINEGVCHTVFRRVANANGKVYLDLADSARRAVEID